MRPNYLHQVQSFLLEDKPVMEHPLPLHVDKGPSALQQKIKRFNPLVTRVVTVFELFDLHPHCTVILGVSCDK